MMTYDMRNPSRPGYDDAMQVTVRRRSITERLAAACWILFAGWLR